MKKNLAKKSGFVTCALSIQCKYSEHEITW